MDRRIQPVCRKSTYKDPFFTCTPEEYDKLLEKSSTVYVGNLSFYTTESQIMELFSMVGPVKQIIMGLDKYRNIPCGFCFVVYFNREDAIESLRSLGKLTVDGRYLRIDIDPGYIEGREYGRGKAGGQVRDDYREEYDKSRGGWGYYQRAAKH